MKRFIIIFALLASTLTVGCTSRRDNAMLAAVMYHAADAAQHGADLKLTTETIKRAADKLAANNGYVIEGKETWTP